MNFQKTKMGSMTHGVGVESGLSRNEQIKADGSETGNPQNAGKDNPVNHRKQPDPIKNPG